MDLVGCAPHVDCTGLQGTFDTIGRAWLVMSNPAKWYIPEQPSSARTVLDHFQLCTML